MPSGSWSVDLPEGRHQIDIDYGYWSGKAIVRVDGRVVSSSRPLLSVAFNRGADVPLRIDQRDVVVSIRPKPLDSIMATGYQFGLTVDGRPAPGTEPMPALRSGQVGPRAIEMLAWASAGGGVIGLSRQGENPSAILFLVAPALCSWVTRRTKLPTSVMALVSLGIIIAGFVVVAVIGAVLRR